MNNRYLDQLKKYQRLGSVEACEKAMDIAIEYILIGVEPNAVKKILENPGGNEHIAAIIRKAEIEAAEYIRKNEFKTFLVGIITGLCSLVLVNMLN